MKAVHTLIVRRAPAERDDDVHEFFVTLYGSRLGHKIDLERDRVTIIGRELSCEIPIEDDAVSRQHCRLTWRPDGWHIEDLGSTNGTYVADLPVERARLRDGDLVKVGSTIFKFLSTHHVEAAYHEEIYRAAIFDGLTQIHNRRYFEEFTEREISRCRRHDRALTLLLFDVDRFKAVNDTYGHLSGDHVLRSLASVLLPRVRRDELFARYAGDEFVVVLPEAPPAVGARIGEELRSMVETTDFVFDGQHLPTTISVGVGSLSTDMTTPAQLVAAADVALYRAKERGRNCVSS